MDDEVQLINDGKGLAIIGSEQAVERFIAAEGAPSRDLGLPRLRKVLASGGATGQALGTITANHGRWIKLTKESAEKLASSTPMKGSSAGISRAVVTQNGKISGILEFSSKHSGMLTNPAVLAGAAGIMAQLAMQQTMDEITDYLAALDEKVDDILRAQKDAVLAEMIAVGIVLDEAMAIRDRVGRVSEVTWSKVQSTSMTIAATQAYALRQLDALATKLGGKLDMGDLAAATRAAEETTTEWLAVLARCFQLQEACAVLEIDRVFDASPDEVEDHRSGLEAAREARIDSIISHTATLIERLDEAASRANSKVLTSPRSAATVVRGRNYVATRVVGFNDALGISRGMQQIEQRRWVEAASDVKDRTFEHGADGVESARRFGSDQLGRARSAKDKLAGRLPEVSISIQRRKDKGES